MRAVACQQTDRRPALALPAFFSATVFASAALLFWVQPMVAKMQLPLLGGTPAVWNTCLLFFQALLLAGYAYAHWLSKRWALQQQLIIHGSLLLLTLLLALPVAVPAWTLTFVPAEANPVWWLLGALLLSAGLPFFAVSTNGVLLQRWFSHSTHSRAQDPYFLYAASNAGSLLALLGYPLLLEPHWRVSEQSQFWTAGFLLLALLVVACGWLVLKGRQTAPAAMGLDASNSDGLAWDAVNAPAEFRITARQRLRWCVLALVPSSLMLGVTTYLTTDIASIPLLWVVPLSLYLLSFVLVFARHGDQRWAWTARVLPMGAIALAYMLLSEATEPAWLLITMHLLVFFLAAVVCHRQLAAERPPVVKLTEFYLWVAIGGALGGLVNALAAPILLTRVAEYPAAIVLACWLRPAPPGSISSRRDRWLDLVIPAAIGALAALLAGFAFDWVDIPLQARLGLIFGFPLLICYAAVDRPIRFALALGAVLAAGWLAPGTHGKTLHIERNFFGVLRVTEDPIGPFVRLVHGNTIHGRQWVDPARQAEPLSYYHLSGPLGKVFDLFHARPASPRVGVVGLGAGSMAGYIRPGEQWTFYEINPAVVRIAENTNYFTFLHRAASDQVQIILGDARLRLREAPSGHFGLLVLDAFSSDAIPLHLITREALALYLSKLAPGGVLAFHISSRSLDLEGVLGDLANDAGLVAHAHDEADPTPAELLEGIDQSHWLVMARHPEDLGRLVKDSRWLPVRGRAQPEVWTDDFSNIVSVFKWK